MVLGVLVPQSYPYAGQWGVLLSTHQGEDAGLNRGLVDSPGANSGQFVFAETNTSVPKSVLSSQVNDPLLAATAIASASKSIACSADTPGTRLRLKLQQTGRLSEKPKYAV
jgi:hypothetical protein